MSEQGGRTQARWWRRGRDVAGRAARLAQEAAAAAMLDLDAALGDLSDTVAVHEESVRARDRHRGPVPDALGRDWRELSARTDAVIGHYLGALADYDPAADLEEPRARTLAAAFEHASRSIREVLPDVARFQQQYATDLAAARQARTSAPTGFAAAVAALAAAQEAVARAEAQSLRDPSLGQALTDALHSATAAEQALASRRWSVALSTAEAVQAAAEAITARADGLDGQATTVRRGALSLRTRREALTTGYARLAPVMSELRRRYPYRDWQQVDRAPARAAEALAQVGDELTALDGLLREPTLDVPAAVARLQQARAAAARVDAEVRAAIDALRRLDEVSADPGSRLAAVRREVVDARRFLDRLPAERQRRYRATFEQLALRLERLAVAVEAPGELGVDWGQILAEAEAIERGLAAMIRTARAD